MRVQHTGRGPSNCRCIDHSPCNQQRPGITSSGTTEDWQYFKSRWDDYVKATRLTGTDRVIQLLECCDDKLRRDLTRNTRGTLTEMTEDEVFAAMKRLAVREENTMVARVTLHNMRQDVRMELDLEDRQASVSLPSNVQDATPPWTTPRPY